MTRSLLMTGRWCGLLVLSAMVARLVSAAPPGGDSAILLPQERLETLWNAGTFTEGAAAAPDGAIYFSDIPGADRPGQILRYDPATDQTSVYSGDSRKSNGLAFTAGGSLIAACGADGGARALCRIHADGRVEPLVERFDGKRFNSPNDVAIHPDGSIYFSDPRYVGTEPMELDHMSVYRFEPRSGSLRRVTSEITKPNGVVFSPDGGTLYVAETNNGSPDVTRPEPEGVEKVMTLNAFAVRSDGTLGNRKKLVDFGAQPGIDGMTVDRDGRIYAAVRNPDRFGICVYTPEGDEVAFIPTGELPTNCCFGRGDDRHSLYITAGTGLYRLRIRPAGAVDGD